MGTAYMISRPQGSYYNISLEPFQLTNEGIERHRKRQHHAAPPGLAQGTRRRFSYDTTDQLVMDTEAPGDSAVCSTN